jgi:GAF domain-containing protein
MDTHAMGIVNDAARAMGAPHDAAATLEEIVIQARRCLPEFEHVSVSRMCPEGTLQTLAATTDLARALDAAQSEAREGPCVDAGEHDETVVVRHAAEEQRWPAYLGKALPAGLRSQLGVRLATDGQGLICLNLHSTTHDDIDDGAIGVAEHFAVHAGLALGRARQEDHLRTAIGTRTVIGTAIGILMERIGLDRQQAFDHLVAESSRLNRKLREVAADLVSETEGRDLERAAGDWSYVGE